MPPGPRHPERPQYWRRGTDEDPHSAEAAANTGLYYFGVKNYEMAASWAQKALDLDPGLANASDLLEKSRSAMSLPTPALSRQAGEQFAVNGDALAAKGDAPGALQA